MRLDLELVLVIGALVTGVVWLLDRFMLAPRRRSALLEGAGGDDVELDMGHDDHDPWYVEYAKSFFPVLFIVLVLRSFIAEPFRIPSGSMMPTLLVGDFILVNKYAYGVRLPVINRKVLDVGEPERGDVAVFRFPLNPADDYIKRIVGLPGDRITYRNKVLYVNGETVDYELVGDYEGEPGTRVFNETLDDVEHQILLRPGYNNLEGEWTVPVDRYFVMGDNRDNSNDSRRWKYVPRENLVGRAFMIWLNWDWKGGVFDSSRIGTRIQ